MTSSKSTKRALISSALAILMCVAMLIGTTFAWFTDTASTAVNKIQAGTLDVALEMKDNDNNWVSAEGKQLEFKAADGRGAYKILWEPGCRYELPALRVVNKGNLALKYKMVITGINGDAKLKDVITWTLNDSEMTDVSLENAVEKKLGAGKTSDEMVIKATMSTEAGNEYQGLSMGGISVTVYATQDTVEKDSIDETYDAGAEYSDEIAVTPETVSTVDFSKSNVKYTFASGTYGNVQIKVKSNTNTAFEAAEGATFEKFTLTYQNPGLYNVTAKNDSTLTVKGFKVAGELSVEATDENVVITENTAAQLTVKAHSDGVDGMKFNITNNIITGGEKAVAPNGYGIYFIPDRTDYTLSITNNVISGVKSHAISVQGSGSKGPNTAAKEIVVSNNEFNSYGAKKAAFKIWNDTKLAPNNTDPLNEAAQALAESVKNNNTFSSDLNSTCVVADFYGKTVAFN